MYAYEIVFLVFTVQVPIYHDFSAPVWPVMPAGCVCNTGQVPSMSLMGVGQTAFCTPHRILSIFF